MNGRGQAKQKMAVASEDMLNLPMQPGADLHVRRDQRSDHGGDEDNRAAKRDLFRAGTGHSPNIPWSSSWPGLSPAIHVFALGQKFVDARHKAVHDEEPVERPR